MTVQEKMKEYRKQHGYSVDDMSFRSGASATLLRMLERGNVTHPKIARQVGTAYELSKEDIFELMPENHRPGENYDPEKYVIRVDRTNDRIFPRRSNYNDEFYVYLAKTYGQKGDY